MHLLRLKQVNRYHSLAVVMTASVAFQNNAQETVLDEREAAEQLLKDVPFALYQHNPNYILPFSYATNPNPDGQTDLNNRNISNSEAKFQISVKVPIYSFGDTATGFYFGFTTKSFWQVYTSEASKPFRETNYEPELMYRWQTDYRLLGIKFNAFQVSLNHESNGQSGLNSRSWNRVLFSTVFSSPKNAYYIETWWRIPEDTKVDINDPTGDDNPDIHDFVGRMEVGNVWQIAPNHKLLTRWRNNLDYDNNRGSITLNYTYSFTERYDLLIQYFNGYGESLIEYNRHQSRVGIGIQLKFI